MVGLQEVEEELKGASGLRELCAVTFHRRTCKVNLYLLLYQLRRDCVIWACPQRKDLPAALQDHPILHLIRRPLHCCFALDWQQGLMAQAVPDPRALSCPALVALRQLQVPPSFLRCFLFEALIGHW